MLCMLHPADPQQNMILAEGISRLCDDLGVEPSDIVLVSCQVTNRVAADLQQCQTVEAAGW